MSGIDTSELQAAIDAFASDNADLEFVDLLISDTNGLIRGKRIEADTLVKTGKAGVLLPGSVFGTNIEGDTVEATGLGMDVGDADLVCWPLAHTLARVPWRETPSAQCLMSMYRPDGTPFYGDPRHLLASVIEKLSAMGYTPVIAVELEFYLTDPDDGPKGMPLAPRSPETGERETATQVYGIAELDEYEDLIRGIRDACKSQDIPAHTVVAEYAPGQYEVNLQHIDDPLKACDHAVMLKRLIKAESARHGFGATFMPKPYADQTGSGMHIHCSLLDSEGSNVFDSGDEKGSDLLRHAAGGLLEHMQDCWLLFAPNANSYRRFVADAFVPMTPTWGYNNRTVAVRIPSGPPAATRIEHRVAGADANPYLVVAAVLAAMADGIERGMEPPPAAEGDAIRQFPPESLPNWKESLDRFRDSPFLSDWFGDEYKALFHAIKSDEHERFNRRITSLEYTWYLKSV